MAKALGALGFGEGRPDAVAQLLSSPRHNIRPVGDYEFISAHPFRLGSIFAANVIFIGWTLSGSEVRDATVSDQFRSGGKSWG
ncbi:MAG TPA: hypothetical protein VGP48_00460 [Stellaceae bacterium]|jgi:hypothetical protein|nr:hypothetical protein [Stellaceae bacterium]